MDESELSNKRAMLNFLLIEFYVKVRLWTHR